MQKVELYLCPLKHVILGLLHGRANQAQLVGTLPGLRTWPSQLTLI